MARGSGSSTFEGISRRGEKTVAMDQGNSRRNVLKAMGAAVVGAVTSGVLNADEAEAGHGIVNATSNESNRPAIHAENTAFGTGAEIVSNGPALIVQASASDTAINAFSECGTALFARAIETSAIFAESPQYSGVVGRGDIGVEGVATEEVGPGDGVHGTSPNGNGVRGTAHAAGVGVKAEARSSAATALHVEGRSKFSTAASGMIPAGQGSGAVANPIVTALSHITVTLTGDPGQAGSVPGTKPVVVWVERQPGTGFIVHMSRPVRFATPFTYLVVEPV
jgi:hypothetical protein